MSTTPSCCIMVRLDLTHTHKPESSQIKKTNFMLGRNISMENTPRTYPPDNTSSWPPPPSLLCPTAATFYLLPSLYILLFLTGLPGNVISLWVFLRRISTKTSTHVYLCNLSSSNLLVSLTAPFLAAYYAQGLVWQQSDVMCQLVLHSVTPVLHINIYIGFAILTCVALSRFSTLIQHTHASRPSACTTMLPHAFFACLRRTSFARRMCATLWVVAVGCTLPVSVYYSVKEAAKGNGAAAGKHGRDEKGGGSVQEKEKCYNQAVEIGGGLSRASNVPAVTIFFVCFLLVLLSYITVLRHIRRSRRSTNITASHGLLGRVFRNIVVIQVVLAVCLLPYHIFKVIFIPLVLQHVANLGHTSAADPTSSSTPCHPFSTLIEIKNCLLLLTALRGSTDPVVYFLLDTTFRKHALSLFRRRTNTSNSSPSSGSRTRGAMKKRGKSGVESDSHQADSSKETGF